MSFIRARQRVRTHCSLYPRVLPLAHFALAIKVPVRLCQQFRNVGTFSLKRVPEVLGRDDITFTSLQCLVQTEQADDIRGVTVEVLSSCCRIDSNLVDLGGVVSKILR